MMRSMRLRSELDPMYPLASCLLNGLSAPAATHLDAGDRPVAGVGNLEVALLGQNGAEADPSEVSIGLHDFNSHVSWLGGGCLEQPIEPGLVRVGEGPRFLFLLRLPRGQERVGQRWDKLSWWSLSTVCSWSEVASIARSWRCTWRVAIATIRAGGWANLSTARSSGNGERPRRGMSANPSPARTKSRCRVKSDSWAVICGARPASANMETSQEWQRVPRPVETQSCAPSASRECDPRCVGKTSFRASTSVTSRQTRRVVIEG